MKHFFPFPLLFTFIGITNSSLFAQDCNDLGQSVTTAQGSGIFYERTEPNPFGQIQDPGLSIKVPSEKFQSGMLVGSSMRLQTESGPSIVGLLSGITTRAACVNGAILNTPNWGGSGKGYWDVDAGVTVDTPTPTNWNASNTASANACWQTNWSDPITGANGYEFSYTVDFANNTSVDGLYWEVLDQTPQINNFKVFVDNVEVSSSTPAFAIGSPVSTDTGTTGSYSLEYHYEQLNLTLSGVHTISVVGTGPDFVMGDFAIFGCCDPEAVPEPSSALLIGMSIIGLASRRRR